MATATPERTEDPLDAVFAALGNGTRRWLMTRLGEGDATISELAEPLDMTLPAVSKHLRVLERAGLVTRTREGKSRRCHLRPGALESAEQWIAERRAYWTGTLDSFAEFVEATDRS